MSSRPRLSKHSSSAPTRPMHRQVSGANNTGEDGTALIITQQPQRREAEPLLPLLLPLLLLLLDGSSSPPARPLIRGHYPAADCCVNRRHEPHQRCSLTSSEGRFGQQHPCLPSGALQHEQLSPRRAGKVSPLSRRSGSISGSVFILLSAAEHLALKTAVRARLDLTPVVYDYYFNCYSSRVLKPPLESLWHRQRLVVALCLLLVCSSVTVLSQHLN